MGGKGTSVNYPGPSAEERALQAKQLALMEAAEAREKQWEPILLSEMGYARDSAGNLRELSEAEKLALMTTGERQAWDISRLASERELKALRGELDIDPATERQLSEEEAALRQRMFQQLGSGWETSTPGIQALGEFQQRGAAIRDAVRRGEMTTTESLAQSRQSQTNQQLAQFLQNSLQPTQRQLGVASAYQQPLSWYGQQRANVFAENQAEAQMRAERARQMSSSTPGSCTCAIFLEGGKLTSAVRRFRDAHYSPDSFVSKGYKAMSSWLVPKMKSNKLVRNFIMTAMLNPLERFASAYETGNKWKAILLCPFGYFWTGVWSLYGRVKISF